MVLIKKTYFGTRSLIHSIFTFVMVLAGFVALFFVSSSRLPTHANNFEFIPTAYADAPTCVSSESSTSSAASGDSGSSGGDCGGCSY